MTKVVSFTVCSLYPILFVSEERLYSMSYEKNLLPLDKDWGKLELIHFFLVLLNQ